MRGKGVRQTALSRQLCRKQAGAEQPDRHVGARAGHGNQPLAWLRRGQQALQLGHVLRKIISRLGAFTPQRAHGCLVGTGRAAQTEVNSSGIQLGQRAKRLGHHQRCMVRQHDAAGTDPQRVGTSSDITDQHGRGRTGNALHVVMLGQPVAGKAQTFRMLRGSQRNRQCIRHCAAFADGDEIEHGQGNVLKCFHDSDCRGSQPSALVRALSR